LFRQGRTTVRPYWQWHLDEVFVKINGETHYLWRAVDHEGEVLESFVTKRRDRKAALKFLRKTMKRHGRPHIFVTDRLAAIRLTS
jgi:putative transposase